MTVSTGPIGGDLVRLNQPQGPDDQLIERAFALLQTRDFPDLGGLDGFVHDERDEQDKSKHNELIVVEDNYSI